MYNIFYSKLESALCTKKEKKKKRGIEQKEGTHQRRRWWFYWILEEWAKSMRNLLALQQSRLQTEKQLLMKALLFFHGKLCFHILVGEGGDTSREAVVVLLDSWGRVWGIFWLTELADQARSSSLWKLFSSFMESYAFIFGRRKTTVSCYWLLYVPLGERTGGLISIIKRSEFFLSSESYSYHLSGN